MFPVFAVLELGKLLSDFVHVFSKFATASHGFLKEWLARLDLEVAFLHVASDVSSHSIVEKVGKLIIVLKAVFYCTTFVFTCDSIIPASSKFCRSHTIS